MPVLGRRCTYAPQQRNSESPMVHISGLVNHNTLNMHHYSQNIAVHKWFTKTQSHKTAMNFFILSNMMINHVFQVCNHRCEVCGKSNHIQINRENQTDTLNETNSSREINFFKTGNIILPENLDSN